MVPVEADTTPEELCRTKLPKITPIALSRCPNMEKLPGSASGFFQKICGNSYIPLSSFTFLKGGNSFLNICWLKGFNFFHVWRCRLSRSATQAMCPCQGATGDRKTSIGKQTVTVNTCAVQQDTSSSLHSFVVIVPHLVGSVALSELYFENYRQVMQVKDN